MRKIISLSIVLVAISLIGVIVLQIMWVRNAFVIQKQRIYSKVDQSIAAVVDDIMESSSTMQTAITLRPKKPSLSFPGTASDPLKIVYLYTVQDISKKLQDAFNNHDLKNLPFEFEIREEVEPTPLWEMRSQNFVQTINALIKGDDMRVRFFTPDQKPAVNSESIVVIIPDINKYVWQSLIWVFIGLALFTVIAIAAFYLTLRTMLEQRRLSKIKSDFINNMTHELKTPLATISLAIDALHNPKVQGDTEKSKYFGGIIKEENKRMNKHVETILQAALMEKQELKFSSQPLHVHDIVKNVVGNFELQLQDKQGNVTLNLKATNDVIDGDEVHFTNLINNLIDNAVKYAQPERPLRIAITSRTYGKNFILQVQDNGIGMNKETVKRVFEKFYRAHTGNIHNVKGFGLGMSYVKTVIDAHKGKIKVDSLLGKGSTFTVEVPLSKESRDDNTEE